MAELPEPADALPAAEHHCRRAAAHLEGRPGARGTLLAELVGLLEAAGGPDVGNAVRTHLERTGAVPPGRLAADRSRARVLLAARRLHLSAEGDLRATLRAAGLDGAEASAASAASATDGEDDPRLARARHVRQVLDARRRAVDVVLRALAGEELPASAGSWDDVLRDGAVLPEGNGVRPDEPPGRQGVSG